MTSTPAATIAAFADCLQVGDLDRAVALYEPDAVFQAAPDAPAVRGRGAIREALTAFMAARPRLTGEILKVHEAGDTALVVNRWTLEPLGLSGTSADVLRRRPSGEWAILVDDPWGGQARTPA
jgi:ketosteroid isomerase-like protein